MEIRSRERCDTGGWRQIALSCFIGRNSGLVDDAVDTAPFAVRDPAAFWAAARAGLLDHGRGRFIISAHLVKTLLAAEQLAASHQAETPLLAAALKRFFQAPLKERHIRRIARQMLDLVAEE